MVTQSYNSGTQKTNQDDCEFESCLSYRVRLRSAWEFAFNLKGLGKQLSGWAFAQLV